MKITYRFRVKDRHAARLNAQARAVNIVWNFCNQTQKKAVLDGRKWLTAFDLVNLTSGATKEGLDLSAETVNRVCIEFGNRRRLARKPWLRWRGKKCLGWIPFNTNAVRFKDGGFVYRGRRYDVWLTRDIQDKTKFGAGSFSQDSRGRWYINLPVDEISAATAKTGRVGIDLGLKSFAALSTGEAINMPSFYRRSELKLARAQRARNLHRAKALHAKIANQRRDFLHKVSTKIASSNNLIVVGDVSPSKLAKTSMAKSVHDAGWYDFKRMLSYKAVRHGGIFLEVDESYTTQTCSGCGSIAGPKGYAGLNERMWTCRSCGTPHDRDINAALNILAAGCRRLAEENPTSGGHQPPPSASSP